MKYRLIAVIALLIGLAKITLLYPRAGLVMLGLIPLALLGFFLLRLALRSQSDRVTTGDVGMIGMIGRAETELSPDGTVFVRGELWRAHATMPVIPGESVRVIGLRGLLLEVEPADRDAAMRRRQFSAFAQTQLPGGNDNG